MTEAEFTPNTEQVWDSYANGEFNDGVGRDAERAEFDRWLAEERAKAWDEGAKWGAVEVSGDDAFETRVWLTPGDNPYRSKGEA